MKFNLINISEKRKEISIERWRKGYAHITASTCMQ